jgi:hypothetical protein
MLVSERITIDNNDIDTIIDQLSTPAQDQELMKLP